MPILDKVRRRIREPTTEACAQRRHERPAVARGVPHFLQQQDVHGSVASPGRQGVGNSYLPGDIQAGDGDAVDGRRMGSRIDAAAGYRPGYAALLNLSLRRRGEHDAQKCA
jgi:hypothetical protein